MIIEKIIWKKIDVKDPIGLCAGDTRENIMRIVRDMIEGRCDGGAYIIRVLEIEKYGEIMINQNGRPNFATVDVCARVRVLHITRGEPIIGVEITAQKNGETSKIALGRAPGVRIIINSANIDAVKAKQKIIAEAMEVNYTIYKQFVAVNARVFTGYVGCGMYKIDKTEYSRERLAELIKRAGTVSVPSGDAAAFFYKLLGTGAAALAISKSSVKAPNVEKFDTLSNIKSGTYCGRTRVINLLEPLYMVGDKNTSHEPVVVNLRDFIEIVFADYFMIAQSFEDIVKYYADTYNENDNLWKYIGM